MAREGHFIGADGTKYAFQDLGHMIREDHPSLVGAHVFKQLTALDLWAEFSNGRTPIPLPYSFTD